jgi:hypothetical protein
MKLHGIILPTSLAVSTPTIVPAGALAATVKLLIVIVMNLSGGALRPQKRMSGPLPGARERLSVVSASFAIYCIIHNYLNVNMATVEQINRDAFVTPGGTLH